MKKCENGVISDLTQQELQSLTGHDSSPATATIEDRVSAVESDMAHVKSEMEDFNYIFTGKEAHHAK